MTDLITRLRDDYACGLQSRLCDEAADEIDRLRAELQNARNKLKASGRTKLREDNDRLRAALREVLTTVPDSWPGAEAARAALG